MMQFKRDPKQSSRNRERVKRLRLRMRKAAEYLGELANLII